MGKNIETTAEFCAELCFDLGCGLRMERPAGRAVLRDHFARAIAHQVRVFASTLKRAEVEALTGLTFPPDVVPAYSLAVGVTPDGVPAFAAAGFLADSRQPTQPEIEAMTKTAIAAFGYGPELQPYPPQGEFLQ